MLKEFEQFPRKIHRARKQRKPLRPYAAVPQPPSFDESNRRIGESSERNGPKTGIAQPRRNFEKSLGIFAVRIDVQVKKKIPRQVFHTVVNGQQNQHQCHYDDALSRFESGHRAQARKAYTHSSNRGNAYKDYFCLTPIGVRVGYASPKLLANLSPSEQKQLAGRVVWASTSSGYYALGGVRPGATVTAARQRFNLGAPFHVGLNYWYLAPHGVVTAILKVRHGIVQEIGIANARLTSKRAAERAFLTSFS